MKESEQSCDPSYSHEWNKWQEAEYLGDNLWTQTRYCKRCGLAKRKEVTVEA